jgi:hypothetical protein
MGSRHIELIAGDMNRSRAHRINGLPSQPSGFACCPLLDSGVQPKRASESRKPGIPYAGRCCSAKSTR